MGKIKSEERGGLLKQPRRKNREQRIKTLECYGVLSTQIIGFFVFTLYPMLWAAKKALYYYDGLKTTEKFVGLSNFVAAFTTDTTYWKTWLFTLKFALMKMPLELGFAMILALMLYKDLKGRGFFRAMFYLPNVISIAIVGVIFTNLFDYFGFINAWLVKLNIVKENVEWFAQPLTAQWALVLGSVWCTFGVNVLYFIAALNNVPEELYESAKLDGANAVTIFFKITLPLMAPVLQTILLLSLNGTLQTSDYILVTTNGAPGGETFTVMSYLVSKFVPGFAEITVNIGYGCALSIITSIIMCLIAVGYTKVSAKLQNLY